MPSLTELLDKPVRAPRGEEVARLKDLVVRVPDTDADAAETPCSRATAVIVTRPPLPCSL